MPTVLDVIVLIVVLISAILAMVRGFVREVLSIGSWVVAAGAAYFLYKPVVPLLAPYIESETVRMIVALAAIFFVALIIASYITMKISDFVIDSRVGAVDRALGFIFGAVRGALLMVIALWFFNFLVPRPPAWVADAQSEPILVAFGDRLVAALPADVEAWIQRYTRGGGGEASPPAEAGEEAPARTPGPGEPGYATGERGTLDQLFENAGEGEQPGD